MYNIYLINASLPIKHTRPLFAQNNITADNLIMRELIHVTNEPSKSSSIGILKFTSKITISVLSKTPSERNQSTKGSKNQRIEVPKDRSTKGSKYQRTPKAVPNNGN